MRASELFGGGAPLGSLTPFPDTAPNMVSISGQVYLKAGVIALASAYPNCPLTTLAPGAAVMRTRPEAFASVAFSPTLNVFVAAPVSMAGSIYSSVDGGAWVARQANIGFACQLIYWTGTRFIAFPLGGTTTAWYSTTGTGAWTSFTLPNVPGGGTLTQICQVGPYIVVNTASGNATWYSTDSGATWSIGSVPGAGGEIVASSTTFMFINSSRQSAQLSANNGLSFGGTTVFNASQTLGPTRSDGTYIYADNYTAVPSLPTGTIRTQDGVNWAVVGSKNSVTMSNNYAYTGGMFVWQISVGKLGFSVDGVVGKNAAAAPFQTNLAGVSPGLNSGNFAYGAGVLVCACGGSTQGVNYGTYATYVDNTIASSMSTGTSNYMRVA